MGRFRYRAVDEAGKTVTGILEAGDASVLEADLREHGYWLIDADTARETAESRPKSTKVRPDDLLEFATSMNTLLSAGIPLLESLTNLAAQPGNPRFQAVLQRLAKTLETGVPLHEALGEHPKIFSKQVVSLMKAGEESGTLQPTFANLQQHLEWAKRLKEDVRQATIYPATVLLAVLGLVTILFTFVIPRFRPVLEGLNVPLPAMTRLVFQVSEILSATWWMWLLGGVGLVGALRGMRAWPQVAAWVDRVKLNLPVVGELHRLLALSRFTQNFGVLYGAGIPVLHCLDLCRDLVGNAVLSQALGNIQDLVAEGALISDAMRGHAIFPPMMVQMVAVGEASGNLERMILHVAKHQQEEIPRRVKKIFGLIEPVIILTLIGVVGVVALAIFLPMMSVMGGLR